MVQADGTQNYGCLPLGAGVAWTLLGPQATLFDVNLNQVMTHYLSPNPVEGGIPRATWRHSHDSSAVWAVAVETSSDAAYVAPGAIPWLKLEAKGARSGTRRRDQAHRHEVHPACEHRRRQGPGHRVRRHRRHRQASVRALHHRLRLLPVVGGAPVAGRYRATSPRRCRPASRSCRRKARADRRSGES